MAEKNNSTCAICGKGYHLCMSCKDKMKLTPWKVLTDTSEHYKIFQVVRGFCTGIYSKADAKKALQNVDLSDKDTFIEPVKKKIDEIMMDEKSANPVEEDTVAEEIEPEVKPIATRKRRAKAVETE